MYQLLTKIQQNFKKKITVADRQIVGNAWPDFTISNYLRIAIYAGSAREEL
ncbi:MAG: hypothetical protein KBF13_02220 [Prevotella sp.]|nr:hypothetical protein [Prevotella sp.]